MKLARLLASGLGVGWVPKAPGTAGSAAALLPGAALLLGPAWLLPLAIILVSLAGWWAVARCEGAHDPGWVVIDEVAGQWCALLPLSTPTLPGLLAGFLLFRLFDITKPGPIGWVDQRTDALGVMADDWLAGLAAAALLWVALHLFPGLLAAHP